MLKFTLNKTFILLLIIAFIVIGAYTLNFQGNSVSDNPEQWGQLGDYVGGILNPVLSFTTVIILITTVRIQNKQLSATREELALTREELQRTAEAATKQAEHFEKEAKLKEHLVLIEKLATRINRNYNGNNLDRERSLHTFVNAHTSKTSEDYIKIVLSYYQNNNGSQTQRVILWIVSDLKRLSELIDSYGKISQNGNRKEEKYSPIPRFYQHEFGELANTLFTYSIIEANLADFYNPK